jgi:putative FmdB family regulatory protein
MPTYEYECQTCHERVEAVQKFTDPSLTTCSAVRGRAAQGLFGRGHRL